MLIRLLIPALSLYAVAAHAQSFWPPKVVGLENVQIEGDIGTVYAGNGNRIYSLYCAAKVASWKWKIPSTTQSITLAFGQNATVKCNKSKDIGIVPTGAKGYLGSYLLDSTGGGYQQGAIFTNGPIIYGTGMSDEDRRKAWAHFFLMMAQAVDQQQGRKALGAKLVRRCLPHQNFCTTILDANLVGISGMQEPRKVIVIITTDIHDQNKQLSRIVCTRPAPGKQVCRDWDTGQLVIADMPSD